MVKKSIILIYSSEFLNYDWSELSQEEKSCNARRAVTRGSITKLGSKITEVESSGEHPDSIRVAQTLATKLKVLDAEVLDAEVLDAEFKIHMLAIIDLTDEEEALALRSIMTISLVN